MRMRVRFVVDDRRIRPRQDALQSGDHRQFAAFGDRLALQPMSERALRGVLAELYPNDSALGGRALANRGRAREAVVAIFRQGDTVGNAPGSQWAAWNAIVEHHDHGRRPRSLEGGWPCSHSAHFRQPQYLCLG